MQKRCKFNEKQRNWFRRMQCSRGVWIWGFVLEFSLGQDFVKSCEQRRSLTQCRAALFSSAPSKTLRTAKWPSAASRAARNNLVKERGYLSRNWLVWTRDGLVWSPLLTLENSFSVAAFRPAQKRFFFSIGQVPRLKIMCASVHLYSKHISAMVFECFWTLLSCQSAPGYCWGIFYEVGWSWYSITSPVIFGIQDWPLQQCLAWPPSILMWRAWRAPSWAKPSKAATLQSMAWKYKDLPQEKHVIVPGVCFVAIDCYVFTHFVRHEPQRFENARNGFCNLKTWTTNTPTPTLYKRLEFQGSHFAVWCKVTKNLSRYDDEWRDPIWVIGKLEQLQRAPELLLTCYLARWPDSICHLPAHISSHKLRSLAKRKRKNIYMYHILHLYNFIHSLYSNNI